METICCFAPKSLRVASWIGGLRATNSPPAWTIVFIAALLAASLVAYGVLGSYARKARVPGILAPHGGELNVVAPVVGRVTEIRVREGQFVKVGEVLMVLDTDRTTESRDGPRETTTLVAEQIENRRHALSSQRQALQSNARLQKQAIESRLRDSDLEIQKLEDEIDLQKRRQGIAAAALQRYEELAVRHFVSSNQVQQHQEALIDQEARLRSMERSLVGARKDRNASMMELRLVDTQLAADIAALERDLAGLNQEDAENRIRRFAAITAGGSGTVTALAVSSGQSVAAGQSLAAMQPASTPLDAHLYAPSRTVGFVREGQQVLVRFAAFPYQKFGVHYGTVSAISRSAFAPNELPPSLQALFGQQPKPEGLYRITVSLAGQEVAAFGQSYGLRSGMSVEADIVQERRTILEWLFEPLIAFARRS